MIEKMDSSKKTRNSSIELLKILGIILIVLSHAVPLYGNKNVSSYINLDFATKDISEFILILFRYLGQIGNIIFIMCSSYFLVNSKEVKIKKVLYIIADCFIISIIFLMAHLFCKVEIPFKDIIKQILPITFKTNWFIGCYLILYIIHPFLNRIIKMSKKQDLLRINLVFIVCYCIISWILRGRYYYTQLIGFIVIYFIVAYDKIYLQNFSKDKILNTRLLIIGLCLFISLIVITNVLGLKIEFFKDKMLYWNDINNILGILIGLAMLNLFKNKHFENKKINYISSLSLLIYITSENYIFRTYTKPLFYQKMFQYGYILFWVLIEAVLLLAFGIVVSIIYKETLQKILYKVVDRIYILLNKMWNRIEPIILKLS